jgi:xylulokinase
MGKKLLLGYDIGSSSVKASLLDAESGECIASAASPETEMTIDSPREGWAEQHPDVWWDHTVTATKKMLQSLTDSRHEVAAIGISYQMHGLVMVNKNGEVLYPAIIWCDSRAVETGNKAFEELGSDFCLSHYLNSPGNFTASKLKWVKENLKDIYSKIWKVMLPGDYIAFKLTNEITTTISGLSEGIFWDFNDNKIADDLVEHLSLDKNLLPELVPTAGRQGTLTGSSAQQLGLQPGIPVTYRAGDQPNNALSLNVLNPGEIAATAGTSGVIYGVSDKNVYDKKSRVNTFAHVNYSVEDPITGVLLCINGTGIQYSWLKKTIFNNMFSYNELNAMAEGIEVGAQGLYCLPFGNGAERVFENKDIKGSFSGINLTMHDKGHLVRAVQEGIAFAFRYGLDVMKEIGIKFHVVKAGNSNLFQSKIFKEAFVNTCKVNLEIYNTDGSQGSARGAGIGAGIYSWTDAFNGLRVIEKIEPKDELVIKYERVYRKWKSALTKRLDDLP